MGASASPQPRRAVIYEPSGVGNTQAFRLEGTEMKRCIEPGRPYGHGLKAPALLEFALEELREGELEAESSRDLVRMRELVRRVSDSLDAAVSAGADRMARAR
jgi:hypothetical protein